MLNLRMRFSLYASISVLAFGCIPAVAIDNGQWGGSSKIAREWFDSLKQPDNPLISCCGEADVIVADRWTSNLDGSINATITDGRGILPEGTSLLISAKKIVRSSNNPTGHSIIFYSPVQGVYCFVFGPLH